MKKCSMCREVLPDTNFYSRGDKRNTKQAHCKSCHAAYIRQRYKRLRVRAVEYLGNRCADCKQVFHPVAYDFHHKDHLTKEGDWNKMRTRSWSIITKELDKCDLLCAICHRLRHTDLEGYDHIGGTGSKI